MELECPVCGCTNNSTEILINDSCTECGFPFICEYSPPNESAPLDRLRHHRFILLWTFFLFAIFQIFGSFYYASRATYDGLVESVVNEIQPALELGNMKLEGESNQTHRVRLGLAYIRRYDYPLFKSIVERIPLIEVTPRDDFFINKGAKMDIVHIGGFISLPEGIVTLKRSTVIGNSSSQIYDRTIITIASVIIHEYEHARRYDLGISQQGASEEITVEQSVFKFLLQSNAPPGMIDEKKKYLDNPYLRKYTQWYRFGESAK